MNMSVSKVALMGGVIAGLGILLNCTLTYKLHFGDRLLMTELEKKANEIAQRMGFKKKG